MSAELVGKIDWEDVLDGPFRKVLAFRIDADSAGIREALGQFGDGRVRISVSAFIRRRSLDSNSYFHVLCRKLAQSLRPPISEARCKNMMLARYGQRMLLPDGGPAMIKTNIPEGQALEMDEPHLWPAPGHAEEGISYYWLYRGSHDYDQREMGILIDGLVEECREMGIPTETPDEIARMNALWGQMLERRITR